MAAPVITSPQFAGGTIGGGLSYQIVATNMPTSYSASGLPQHLVCDPDTGLITGRALSTGEYSCTMTAANDDGSDTKPLTISIVSGTKPVFTSDTIAYAIAGVPFSFTVHATQNATYSSPSLPVWLTLDPLTGILSGTPPVGVAQTYLLKIRATQPDSGLTTDSILNVVVSIDANRPVITSDDNLSIITGAPYTFQLMATNNPTHWSVDMALPAGLTLNHDTGLISGAALVPQTWQHYVTASNSSGDGLQLLTIYVSDGGLPQKPIVTSVGTVTTPINQPFAYQITATNNPKSFAVAGTLPPGISFNEITGTLYGIPTAAGTYSLKQIAINDSGQGFEFFSLVVALAPATPVVTSAGMASGTAGQGFSYFITGTNSPTSYDATGLPPGLHINTLAGLITGTLEIDGVFNINLRAMNGSGAGAGVLVLTVGTGNKPTITSDLNVIGTTGFPFNYQILATNNPTSFEANPFDLAAAGDMTIDEVTGAISGTLGAPGSFSIRITAHNDFGRGDATLILGIVDVGVPVTPVVTSPRTAAGVVGFGFQYQITGTNNPFKFSAQGLPDGLSVNPDTGLIYGTPATAGTFTVLVGAMNDFGTGVLGVTFTIAPTPLFGSLPPSPAVPDAEGSAPERVDVQFLTCVAKLRYVEKNPDEQLTNANVEAYRLMITAILKEQEGDWAAAEKAQMAVKGVLDREVTEYLAGLKFTLPVNNDIFSMSDLGEML